MANIFHSLLNILSIIAKVLLSSISVAVDEADENNQLSDSPGGSLNYRTGERDDGTDPYGWYDHK